MTFVFLFFQAFSEYSYSLNTIKSFFSKYKPQLLLNIFFLYPLLILFSVHEIKKYNFKKNKNKKNEIIFKFIIIINIVFIVVIFIEDVSYKTYFYQNTLNLISMYIAFIIYIIYFLSCFVINSLDLTDEANKQLYIVKNIEIIFNSNLKLNQRKILDNSNNSTIDIKQTYINELNKEKHKDLPNEEKKDNTLNYNYDSNNYYNYDYNNDFKYIKLCIIQGIFWLSDETEKIYLFISLIFFEFSSYMIKYLNRNIFNKANNKTDLDIPLKENKKVVYISIIFYITIQKITITTNHLFFLLILHSYDINSCKQQQQKFIKISPNLALIISYIVNFKFSFLTSAYYFEKNFFKKENNKRIVEFSLFFIVKRIIVNVRMNYSAIIIIANSLMHIKEEQLWDFCAYYLEEIIFFLLDYLYVVIGLIFFKILN